MIERGEVIAVSEKGVKVKIVRRSECEKCGMCGMKKDEPSVELDCIDRLGAAVGDTVVVETGTGAHILSLLLVFVVPLILIGAALAVGLTLIKSDLWTLLLCLITPIAWYTILAGLDKKFAKLRGFCPEIKEITGEKKNERTDK